MIRELKGSSLLITHSDDGDWSVWLTLPNHDALDDAFGFVVGAGATRDVAVAAAVETLEEAVNALQGPPDTIVVRNIGA